MHAAGNIYTIRVIWSSGFCMQSKVLIIFPKMHDVDLVFAITSTNMFIHDWY